MINTYRVHRESTTTHTKKEQNKEREKNKTIWYACIYRERYARFSRALKHKKVNVKVKKREEICTNYEI